MNSRNGDPAIEAPAARDDEAVDVLLAGVHAPRLMTAPEAAELLRLKESTLRDYGRRGIIPCIRIGRHVRFVESDLIDAIHRLRSAA